MVKRLNEAKGQDEFHLGEIYLSATPENAAAVADNARKIMEALRSGGSFAAYARQFSEASTAVVGAISAGSGRASFLPRWRRPRPRWSPTVRRPDRGARRHVDPADGRPAPGADRRSARCGAQPQADFAQLRAGHDAGAGKRTGRQVHRSDEDHRRLRRRRCRGAEPWRLDGGARHPDAPASGTAAGDDDGPAGRPDLTTIRRGRRGSASSCCAGAICRKARRPPICSRSSSVCSTKK